MGDFLTTDELHARLGEPGLVILDCTYFLAAEGRDARAEFAAAHVPGARFLDIDAVADPDGAAPHMLPDAEGFAAAMRALGVDEGSRIVVYDNSPLRTAARGWFMARHFGIEEVKVLDGGLGKWRAESRPVEAGESEPASGDFRARPVRDDVVEKAALLAAPDTRIADARPAPRFAGEVPDPRPGVASGHIPGAANLAMTSLYEADGTMKGAEALAALFADAGIDPAQPFVASCGSGVTANSIILAARKLGGGADARLYDGSWSEWGADPATPKATGPARRRET